MAASPGRALSRDRITGLLWPEKDDEQGRHLLSVAVYEIRKELGDDAVISRGDDVAVDPLAVGTDLDDFRDAVEQGRYDEGVDLYRGPFLDGFFLGASSEFEHWVDSERAGLTRLYRKALTARAEALEDAGDLQGAADAWRRAANEDRFDSRVALRLLGALHAAGNRAGALQFARIHEALLQEEFGTSPAPEFTAAVEAIRSETVPETAAAPKRSERRVATVEPVAPAAALQGAPTRPPHVPSTETSPVAGPSDGRPGTVFVAVILIVIAAAAGYLANRGAPDPPPGGVGIAVLPFRPSDPADEAFADGLSEEIMDALAEAGARVPAWSASVAMRGSDAREAAALLGVQHVVDGRVHRDRDSLRIRVQVSGRDGFVVWNESFDRSADEVFATWDQIAVAVIDALPVQLGGDSLSDRRGETSDLPAYDQFVKGRHVWFKRTPDGLGQAIAYFHGAVERDPQFARAYAGLADVYNILGAYDYGVLPPDSAFPLALRYADRAIALAPELGEAHAARANALFAYHRDFEGADEAFRRALALYPHYPEAHHWYSLFLLARGQADEAMAEARRALQLDSLSPVMRTSMARHLYFRGDFAEALEGYRSALAIEPGFVTAHLGVGLALLQLGRADDAITAFERASGLIDGAHPLSMALTANAHGRAGRAAEAHEILDRLQDLRARGRWIPAEYIALVHLGLGDNDAAIASLERAADARSSVVPFLGIEPLASALRGDPRFEALEARGRRPVPR